MNARLTDSERKQLQRWQKQRRDNNGYVKVAMLLLLDKGRSAGSIADDLGLDQATVYRYAAAVAGLGLAKYLVHEQPGYWGRLTSAQLAHLCREVNATLDTDCQALREWLPRTYRVNYSRAGLTDLLQRTQRLHENAPKAFGSCSRLTPTRPAFMLSVTMPAIIKTRNCALGWSTSPSVRCFCRLIRPI